MPLPTSLTFYPLNETEMVFGPLVEGSNPNTIILDAIVTVTLCAVSKGINSSSLITPVVLTLDNATNTYRGMIGGSSFNPKVGTAYVTVVDVTSVSAGRSHWEFPTTIVERTV